MCRAVTLVNRPHVNECVYVCCRDEHNLEENERIKRELNPTKIDEPKTPYHRGVSEDEEEEGDEHSLEMSPLSLSDEVQKTVKKLSAFEKCLESHAGTRVMIGDGDPSSSAAMEEDSLDDASKEEKRKKFLEARKQHYKVGRSLLYVELVFSYNAMCLL